MPLDSSAINGWTSYKIAMGTKPGIADTVKPVYNDHLYNEIYYLRFIQKCVLMKMKVSI